MVSLKNIPYSKCILIDDNYFYENINQKIFLEKSLNTNDNRDQYFLKLYLHLPNGDFICQGYIYFYIKFDTKESHFIGTYIKPEFRNKGLASLLLSNWMQLLFENDIYKLSTSKKQRKPFLLYLLKTYSFEIANISKYDISQWTIDICRSEKDNKKYLMFKDLTHKKYFLESLINLNDNYIVIDELTEDIKKLDSVLLSNPYHLQNSDYAYTKSLYIAQNRNRK